MDELMISPYDCHIFVCTNDRGGQRRSCADGDNVAVRAALKDEVAKRGWKGKVRVSQCGCLGVCESGPNVMIYPQGMWFSSVGADDTERITAEVEMMMDDLSD